MGSHWLSCLSKCVQEYPLSPSHVFLTPRNENTGSHLYISSISPINSLRAGARRQMGKNVLNQPAAPRAVAIAVPSPRAINHLHCGWTRTKEIEAGSVSVLQGFGKAVSDFFWNLPGSLCLSASALLRTICVLSPVIVQLQKMLRLPPAFTPLSSTESASTVVFRAMNKLYRK